MNEALGILLGGVPANHINDLVDFLCSFCWRARRFGWFRDGGERGRSSAVGGGGEDVASVVETGVGEAVE